MADISGIVGPWMRYEDTVSNSPKNEMGKEDFLKLLVAQLTHQDPTSPMQDTEFISQLATYSGLEQQMTMNENLEKLIGSTNTNTATSAVGLINKVVGYIDEEGELQTGLVSFIDIQGGEVYLILHNNDSVPFNNISYIGEVADVEDPGPQDPGPGDENPGGGDGDE